MTARNRIKRAVVSFRRSDENTRYYYSKFTQGYMVNGNIELRKRRGEGRARRRAGKAGRNSLRAGRDSLRLSRVEESTEISWQNNYCSAQRGAISGA